MCSATQTDPASVQQKEWVWPTLSIAKVISGIFLDIYKKKNTKKVRIAIDYIIAQKDARELTLTTYK